MSVKLQRAEEAVLKALHEADQCDIAESLAAGALRWLSAPENLYRRSWAIRWEEGPAGRLPKVRSMTALERASADRLDALGKACEHVGWALMGHPHRAEWALEVLAGCEPAPLRYDPESDTWIRGEKDREEER